MLRLLQFEFCIIIKSMSKRIGHFQENNQFLLNKLKTRAEPRLTASLLMVKNNDILNESRLIEIAS